MQNDSVQLSNSGLVSQSSSPVSPAKPYQCSHCPLILKSKVYLFEHLNKVHGLNVDAALKNSGLKSYNSTSSGSDLKCQRCDFIADSADGFKSHLSQCQKRSEVSGLIASSASDAKPDAKITSNERKEHANNSSKFKSPTASSKHLKIYTKPTQTITKFLVPTSKSTRKSTIADDSQGTLILQEASSSSTPNSSGVCQVSAKSIDINAVSPHCSLRYDALWTATLNNPKTEEKPEGEPPNSVGKRTSSDSSVCGAVKKAKFHTEDATLPQKENASNSKSCNNFDFELSEDESEKRNPAKVGSMVYFCKHCDYSDLGVRGMSNHYKSNHPYVRYNAIYIQDSSDESATFRCLECPVDFINTAKLRRHYKKDHPDAPNVFTKKLSELNLAFKCFLCPFTTTALKNLKEHHDEVHPNHKVGNSLFYCRYSVTGRPKESCQLSKHEGKSEDSSPENGCLSHKKVKSTTLPQPTSKGAGVTLFKCNNCAFSHKSVVVMHVHYQKSHPEEALTIDKIKQLARFTVHATQPTTPEQSANSKMALTKSTALKSPSDPSKKGKAEPLPQRDIRLSFDTCQSRSKSPNDEVEKSLKKKDKSKNPSIKQEVEIPQDEHNYLSHSTADIFYCRFCNFESSKLKSVVCHQNAKHYLATIANSDEICRYSAEVQKRKALSKAETYETIPSCRSEADQQVKTEGEAYDDTDAGDHAYSDPTKLFYCSQCNYANPLAKGIQYHQTRVHMGNYANKEDVIEYTDSVIQELERTKSQPKELPFSTRLPRPHVHKRDRHKFFCHFCNYRHGGIAQVLRHYRKVHREYQEKRTTIEMYTSFVLKQAGKSHVTATVHKEIDKKSLEKVKIVKETKLPKISSGRRKLLRSLLCYKCPYRTQSVYLLRRHLSQVHDKKHLASEILKYCFKQGALQPGFHCEYCVFSHKSGATVFRHYRERHPEKKLSLNYVLTQLRVGPPASPPKNKAREATSSDEDGDDGSPSGQSEAKTYPCSECSFKGSSLASVIQHFRTDHPWTETQSQVQDVSEARPPFDSFQEPLDFEKSTDEEDDDDDDDEESSREFKCPFCPAVLSSHHGLNTHCGLKHQNDVNNAVESTKKVKTRMRLYKCRHCTYVNTGHQGAQAHSHRKHPELTTEPESIHVDMKHVQNLEWLKRHHSGMLKFNAYMCTTCSQLCRTVNKLNRHRVSDHSATTVDTAQSNLTAASKPPIKCKIILPKVHGAQKLKISKAFLSKKGPSMFKCLHCHHVCSTIVKLGQHVRLQHNNKYTISKGSLYRCMLCSKRYFTRKHLAGHYVMKHGKDAYLAHFVPVYMQPKLDATSSRSPSSRRRSESSTSAEESKIQIYRCPFCSYVHTSPHGTLTHCQMKHPNFIVKTDILRKDEIPLTRLVSSKKGAKTKQGGYVCKKCSQVCTSTGKYKVHCQKGCKRTSKDSNKRENVTSHRFQSSMSLGDDAKDEMSEFEIDAERNSHSVARENNSSQSPLTQSESKIYKCHMCNYSGLYRRYLQAHYKQFHKLDSDVVLKLLQKYNKRKSFERLKPLESSEEKYEQISHNKCIKCPDLTFDSEDLLLEHYCTFHRSEIQMDFVVLSTGEKKKSTGLYTCNHCIKQLNGIKKLGVHMHRHREVKKEEARKRASLQESTLDPNSTEPEVIYERPPFESLEEFTPGSVTSSDLTVLSTSPVKFLPKLDDVKQSAPEGNDNKHSCKQCGRSFMSPKVLLSHERSHATMAAIKNFGSKFTTELDSRVSKYIMYKSGVTRPFQCSICLYRTTVLGLWWSHFQKKHQDVVDLTKAIHDEDVGEEGVERMDMEPPDLLKQTDSWTDPGDKRAAAENSMDSEPPDVRRQLKHYNFMAQRNAEAHEQEWRLRRDSLLHCEMCDFNTEHLSSIRRHYLNRHGKKMHRCKQCQFFTESRKVLEMHMLMGHSACQSVPTHQKDLCCPFCLYQTKNKNNMIDHIDLHRDNRVVPIEVRRPKLSRYLRGVVFRCHRCTFMSSSAENLRLHMTRHDDVRPYKCRLCFFDCTQLSDLEAHLNDKHQVMRNHELVGQVRLDQLGVRSGQTPDVEEEPLANTELCSYRSEDEDMEEELFTDCSDAQRAGNQNQGQEGNGESPNNKTLLNIHTTEQNKHEPEPQPGLRSESDEQDQAELWGNEGGETEGSSPTYSNITDEGENTESQRALNIEASVEDDILRNILVLDGSVCMTLKKTDPDRTVNTEPDASPSGERSSIAQDQSLAKISPTHANDTKAEKSFTSEIQTLPPSILPKQPSLSREDGSPACQLEQEQSGRNSDDAPDTCREMPVLENEYLKGKMHLLDSSRQEKDGDHQVPEEDVNMSCEDDVKSCKGQESPSELTADENSYACELCGRKLASSSELKLHTVRHGM